MEFIISLVQHITDNTTKEKEIDLTWMFTSQELAYFETVQHAGYSAKKSASLLKHYWDEAWEPVIVEELHKLGRSTKLMNAVPKNIRGSSNLFCIQDAVFTDTNGALDVVVNFRMTNPIGQLWADLWLFNTVFNRIANQAGLELSTVTIKSPRAFIRIDGSWRVFRMAGMTSAEKLDFWLALCAVLSPAQAQSFYRQMCIITPEDITKDTPFIWTQHKRGHLAFKQLDDHEQNEVRRISRERYKGTRQKDGLK